MKRINVGSFSTKEKQISMDNEKTIASKLIQLEWFKYLSCQVHSVAPHNPWVTPLDPQ